MSVEVQAEIQVEELFALLRRQITGQSRAGLEKTAQAIVEAARESMPWAPGAPRGKPADAGKPPNRQTGELAESLTWALDGDGFVAVGTDGSKVSVQGAVLEYGGRPRSKKRKTRASGKAYKPHPFIGPAFDRVLDSFAPRVAGTFTS